jgi:peptidoglycan/LPS O-acetylase OafA/YrhL
MTAAPHPAIALATRVPSLDGLRALGVLLVAYDHLVGTRGFPIPEDVGHFLRPGPLMLRIFFVISGFLITGLLIREREETGRISLRHFYFRRTFRILPTLYVFLLVLVLVAPTGLVSLKPGDIFNAATFTKNYTTCCHGAWVAHTWSLSVEEQFYLLWPAVVVLAGFRKGFMVAAAFLLAGPFIRLGLWYLAPDLRQGLLFRFEAVGDALAVGCLLAGLRPWLHARQAYRRMLDSRWFILVPAAMLAVVSIDSPRLQAAAGYTAMKVGCALIVDWCITYPTGTVGRFLNWRPMVFLGGMSYSAYVWQSPFINRFSDAWIATFPVNLILWVPVALASFYLVEKPSMRARSRIERWWASRRKPRPAPAEATPGG